MNSRACARKEKAEPLLVFHQALAQKMLTSSLDNDGMTATQIGCTRILVSLKRLEMDHKLTKRPLITGAWDERIGTWPRPGMSTKKLTVPLLDAKTGSELFGLVIRKSPYTKLVTISILLK